MIILEIIKTMKNLIILIAAFMVTKVVGQNSTEMPLYKNGVPNSIVAPNKESSTFRDNIIRIAKVSVPSLKIFKPAKPNGKAVSQKCVKEGLNTYSDFLWLNSLHECMKKNL
jgi:hypothetical protein